MCVGERGGGGLRTSHLYVLCVRYSYRYLHTTVCRIEEGGGRLQFQQNNGSNSREIQKVGGGKYLDRFPEKTTRKG